MDNENSSIEQTDADIPSPQPSENDTTNSAIMEVHHHPDLEHKRKNWREYFLEFLMIFIAVTLGFFAENLRENIAENHIQKEYIESFAADIKSDSKRLSQIIPEETIAIANIDTLYQLLTQTSRSDSDIKKIYYLFRKYTMKFDPMTFNQRTYTQLKNAGGLRLIKNKAVSDSIVGYNKSIDDINSTITYTTHDFMLPALYAGNKIFNLHHISQYTPETIDQLLSANIPAVRMSEDKSLIQEYSNFIYEIKGIRTTYLGQLNYQLDKSKNIGNFLKTEYKIPD